MRLLTALTITCLAVSITALVLVLGLYGELDKTKTKDTLLKDKTTQIIPHNVQSPRCQALSEYIASSLTDAASERFSRAWLDAGCDEEFEIDELLLDIESKANLVRSQVDNLLRSYSKSFDEGENKDCLWHRETWQSRNYLNPRITTYEPTEERWLINITGNSCKGIESFSVNDVNGEVSYLGSSLDK